jgi:cell division topological specificity factor
MRLMSFFRRSSTAPVARERLQILLAHERAVSGKSDLIAILQDEIMAVIAKHFPVDQDSITVKMERGEVVSTLEVEVEIPTPMCPSFPLPKRTTPAEVVSLNAAAPAKPAMAESVRPAEFVDAVSATGSKAAPAEPACAEEARQPGG